MTRTRASIRIAKRAVSLATGNNVSMGTGKRGFAMLDAGFQAGPNHSDWCDVNRDERRGPVRDSKHEALPRQDQPTRFLDSNAPAQTFLHQSSPAAHRPVTAI